MPPDPRDTARMWDMLDAARTARQFVHGRTLGDFLSDRLLRSAVERTLEIVGEAARHVSEAGRLAYPEIPWNAIIGMRNIIAHEYGEVLHEKVWNVCADRLPALIDHLEKADIEFPPSADTPKTV